MTDPYTESARFYDAAYAVKGDLRDVPFYVDFVVERGGTALEIACGTGRILMEIAKRGVPIDGVDSSAAMLTVLRQKLAALPESVRDVVSVTEGDMRTFSLSRTYRSVIIPFRPLQHMYTVEDQVSALERARAHLAEDGRLALDVFFPNMAALADSELGREHHELTWTDNADASITIKRFFVRDAVDPLNQSFRGRFLFRRYKGDTLVGETSSPLQMSYYTYPHLLALFRLAGLVVESEFGTFEREPIDVQKDMIFILKRA